MCIGWCEFAHTDAACVATSGYHTGAACTAGKWAEHIPRQAEELLVSSSSLSCSVFSAAVANAYQKLMRQSHQVCFQMSEESKEPLNNYSWKRTWNISSWVLDKLETNFNCSFDTAFKRHGGNWNIKQFNSKWKLRNCLDLVCVCWSVVSGIYKPGPSAGQSQETSPMLSEWCSPVIPASAL